jgi:D-alanyl-D-alanine dipeptidase
MRFNYPLFFSLFIIAFVGCKTTDVTTYKSSRVLKNNYVNSNSIALFEGINDTTFVKLSDFSNTFVFDMKYATDANFLKTKVYDCEACYLRLKTIKSMINANSEFQSLGYRIKLFDCYRPIDIQKKMWELVPNADYVADPKKGSIHNRGGAVDITLVDANGKELNMGTSFDFFGPEAAHNYQGFSRKVRKNRLLLKDIMLKNHFKSFDSEWWHYNLVDSNKDKVANFKWNCN